MPGQATPDDQTSLTTVILVIAALPVPAFLISLLLPGENEPGATNKELN